MICLVGMRQKRRERGKLMVFLTNLKVIIMPKQYTSVIPLFCRPYPVHHSAAMGNCKWGVITFLIEWVTSKQGQIYWVNVTKPKLPPVGPFLFSFEMFANANPAGILAVSVSLPGLPSE